MSDGSHREGPAGLPASLQTPYDPVVILMDLVREYGSVCHRVGYRRGHTGEETMTPWHRDDQLAALDKIERLARALQGKGASDAD